MPLPFEERRAVFCPGCGEKINYCSYIWNSFQRVAIVCQTYCYCSRIGAYLLIQKVFYWALINNSKYLLSAPYGKCYKTMQDKPIEVDWALKLFVESVGSLKWKTEMNLFCQDTANSITLFVFKRFRDIRSRRDICQGIWFIEKVFNSLPVQSAMMSC